MDGFILVNKPKGLTSHDVVDEIRKIFGLRKVGHTGTLDPEATGLLILCLGKATKKVNYFLNLNKEYLVEMILGMETDTFDAQGKIVSEKECKANEKEIVETLHSFVGKIKQTVPLTSAIKFQGKPLYYYAHRGMKVKPPEREVQIYEIEFLGMHNGEKPKVNFRVKCSKGTYIRSLCSDIGKKLGCGAYQSNLMRTRIGNFSLEDAYALEELKKLKVEGKLAQTVKKIW